MHTAHVQGYLLQYFLNVKSTTLVSAITKLSDIINAYHAPEEDEIEGDLVE